MEEFFKSTFVASSNSSNIESDKEFFLFEQFNVQQIRGNTSTLHLIYLSYLSNVYRAHYLSKYIFFWAAMYVNTTCKLYLFKAIIRY
jgi:hypothetical protein